MDPGEPLEYGDQVGRMIYLVALVVVAGLVIFGCARKKTSESSAGTKSGAPEGTSAVASAVHTSASESAKASSAAPFSTASIPLTTLGFPVALEREFRVSIFGVVDGKQDPQRVIGLLERAGRSAGISRGEISVDDEDRNAPISMADFRAPKRKLGAEGELTPVFALSVSAATLGKGHRFDDAARLAKIWILDLGSDGDPSVRLEQFRRGLEAVGASSAAPLVVLAPNPNGIQCQDKRPIFCARSDEEGAKQVMLQLLRWLDSAS